MIVTEKEILPLHYNAIKSFYDACIESNRTDLLDRWDYELNRISPQEVAHKSQKICYFKCPCGLHESSGYRPASIWRINYTSVKRQPCTFCSSFANWGLTNLGVNFLKDYWDADRNTLDPWQIPAHSNQKVWIKCTKKSYHESNLFTVFDFVGGYRCAYCKGTKVYPFDSLGAKLENYGSSGVIQNRWSCLNTKSPFEYTLNTNQKVWFTCPNGIHDDYLQTVNYATISQFRCPMCSRDRSKSIFQEKIENYITQNYDFNMNFERQCSIVARNPLTGKDLPFDIEIASLHLLIEVNGQQHYAATKYNFNHPVSHRRNPKDELEYQQWKDKLKKDYTISQGYAYLEIPYTTEHNGSYKQLIDDAISLAISKQSEVAG